MKLVDERNNRKRHARVAQMMMWTMVFAFSCSVAWGAEEPSMPTPDRKIVVAHYMVGVPMYGGRPEGFKRDIVEAHEQGIDAFQINIGEWTPKRRETTEMLYQAASECDFQFYLFPSCDYNPRIKNPMRYDQISEYLKLYGNHPNTLKFKGRPIISSWLGTLWSDKGVEYWRTIKRRLKEECGLGIFYVPYFGCYFVRHGGFSPAVLNTMLDEYDGVIDGYWNWGGRLSPFPNSGRSIPEQSEVISQALNSRGLPFMTPVLPAFWMTYKEPDVYAEHEGGRGIESQWLSVIKNQEAQWVNLVTWNDMGEDSHWNPHPNPPNRHVWSHVGHAELNKYYIQWWKSGRQPAIEKDKLFYFYRNQFHDAQGRNRTFESAKQVADLVFVTTMLTRPARLTIHSGEKTTNHDVPAGIRHWRADLGLGIQRFVLDRDGRTLIDKNGELVVVENPEYKSWSVFSGFAQ
jgi:glucan endo-1,3-alpha-glucosidase